MLHSLLPSVLAVLFLFTTSLSGLCVHMTLQSYALLWELAGRFPLLIRTSWHTTPTYEEESGIQQFKNTGANNSGV